ncbi:uncharacterized protein N7479_010651 [Penicillium vulpinum]|uniref:uncharacterized protein n=1 Tax=Penicillium vulpinum TaxID=29845 RepID=UPI0025493FC3|nr:uncharacterized protein N7479_010651 [Penicillium vulpinum]KAJ5952238.1 hypothetical protein N7479_010651 [Penicillium vulpinum]
MVFPNLLSIILSILTVSSFYPLIESLWLKKDSSGISTYYVLFNLIAATEQFTIVFFFMVNNTAGSSVFVHTPISVGDWLNFTQMTVSYVLFLIYFALTLHYLPDNRAHKYTAVAIYTVFLLISVIPELIDVITGGPHSNNSDRDFGLALFSVPHVMYINPVVTLLIIISFIFQAHKSWKESSACMSIRDLAIQALVFALLGVSWLLRLEWPPLNMPSFYQSRLAEVFCLVAWVPVDHFLFALGQALLCFVIWRRGVNAAHGTGETEPLLGGP